MEPVELGRPAVDDILDIEEPRVSDVGLVLPTEYGMEVGPVVDELIVPLVQPAVELVDVGSVITVIEPAVLSTLVGPEVLDTIIYIYKYR